GRDSSGGDAVRARETGASGEGPTDPRLVGAARHARRRPPAPGAPLCPDAGRVLPDLPGGELRRRGPPVPAAELLLDPGLRAAAHRARRRAAVPDGRRRLPGPERADRVSVLADPGARLRREAR